MTLSLTLDVMAGAYGIAKLPGGAAAPDWATGPGLVNVVWAEDETSVVCRAERIPEGVEASVGWVAIRVTTTFDLDVPGVVLAAVRPISEAGLGIFVMSTFERDYILVRRDAMARAEALFTAAGHVVRGTHAPG